MSNELIAYCGLYCGACSFKVAFEQNDRDHIKGMPLKYEKFRDSPMESCPGCRLENQCGKCDIKDCAEEKKLEFCSLCKEFPCVKLEKFTSDGVPHHSESIQNLKVIKKIGPSEWLALQNEKWKCQCGSKYSWYFTKCKKCKS
ncbi:MAG: DUF3795 domain-containing protein [Desulfobacterales bacterium]|nr:DUF3795 domain-containing protein [Desulfobacterales bacterium]